MKRKLYLEPKSEDEVKIITALLSSVFADTEHYSWYMIGGECRQILIKTNGTDAAKSPYAENKGFEKIEIIDLAGLVLEIKELI